MVRHTRPRGNGNSKEKQEDDRENKDKQRQGGKKDFKKIKIMANQREQRLVINDYYGVVEETGSRLDMESYNSAHRRALTSSNPETKAFWARQLENPLHPQQLIYQFQLKGIEFGNWVPQIERREKLGFAYSDFAFLSLLFAKFAGHKTPFTNLGLRSNIGLAIGARGYGLDNAAAHYEPVKNMINLTRKKGAGSLAHEYGHALDFNIGAYYDQDKEKAYASGGRSIEEKMPCPNNGKPRYYINKIVDFINTTDRHKALRERALRTHNDYFIRRTETFARWFEQFIAYCYDEYAGELAKQYPEAKKHFGNRPIRYLCNSPSAYRNSGAYLTDDDLAKTVADGKKLIASIVQIVK